MNSYTLFPRHGIERNLERVLNHAALLRPTHWTKSLIAVPIGPIFLFQDATMTTLLTLLATIAMFVLASSAVYVMNDLSDRERDRLHPTKCLRPLPSGAVTPATARLMLVALFGSMALLSFQLPILVAILVGLYLVSNVAYSFHLKHVPIVEMLIVAMGFALRTASGYLAFGVIPDERVVATVFAGSLLLTIGKRREELRHVKQSDAHRPVLAHYSGSLLDAYLIASALVCFGLGLAAMRHIFDAHGLTLLFFVSLPFVVFLLQRYLMLAFVGTSASNPTRMLLTDKTIHLVLAFWVFTLGVGVWLDVVGIDAAHLLQVAS